MNKWQKHYPLSDKNAFVCLVDVMGDDNAIVQAARVSYGKDKRDDQIGMPKFGKELEEEIETRTKDRQLIRYLMNHSHTTPFEMCTIKFMVQVPMDCWRQWVRHRTASINEYSTRYMEALDFFQVTQPTEWRLQSTDNKQGSSGFLEEWPDGWEVEHDTDLGGQPRHRIRNEDGVVSSCPKDCTPGSYLCNEESKFHSFAKKLYQLRLKFGIAKEQARKDLPLSTFTRAYWQINLHNLFHFLRLRMDSHAQYEIRMFANAIFDIIKPLFPVACEAFEDYVLHSRKFSRMEMELLKKMIKLTDFKFDFDPDFKPDSLTDREWKEFVGKLQ